MDRKLYGRDGKLLVTLGVLVVLAISLGWQGCRAFEKGLLKDQAVQEASYWADFLRGKLFNINNIFVHGIMTRDDQAVLRLASEAGRIYNYRIIDKNGKVLRATNTDEIGLSVASPQFHDIVQQGSTHVEILQTSRSAIDPSPGIESPAETVTVSKALIPFMWGGQFLGAIEVDSDATAMAERLREKTNAAIKALIALLAAISAACGIFITLNIKQRNQDYNRIRDAHRQMTEAKDDLAKLNGELESRVAHRTEELNLALTEISELNTGLEQRVQQRTAELREAQQEAVNNERLAALGQLTATVSHELRNPLGALRTSLFLVTEKTKDRGLGLDRALLRSERSIERCDNIITEMLDFARSTDVCAESTAVDEWLNSVIDDQPEPEGITVIKEFQAPGLSLPIDGDRLRRAVINIFDNGCQAMDEEKKSGDGSKDYAMRIKTAVVNNRYEFSFSDNGPGMDRETQEKIFEPLFSTKSFGVGLGMPTVMQILELHGGGIEVFSEPGAGTVMTLWLPLAKEENAAGVA